jgi:DNA processing protein
VIAVQPSRSAEDSIEVAFVSPGELKVYAECQLKLLRLALVEGIGPRRHQLLLSHFGTIDAVLAANSDQLLGVPGIGPIHAARIASAGKRELTQLLQRCRDHELWMWFPNMAEYPQLLREIPDPPLVLFGRGDWRPTDRYSVAIVGTRRPTAYGRRQAQRLAASVVQAGLVVVSGLARGIDAEAHQTALDHGGRTIAVLGSGLLRVYPSEHQQLAARISKNGVLLSEAPPLRQAVAGAFPQRNRVISGLSTGVVVVEAAERSGALITARHAMEQGRDVFAVPGPADSPQSRGCHQLLRDGAKLVESVDDILEEITPLLAAASGPSIGVNEDLGHLEALSEEVRHVYSHIGHCSQEVESLADDCKISISQLLSILTDLELKRLIRRDGPLLVQRRF